MCGVVKELLLKRYFSKEVRGNAQVPESDIVQECRRLLCERQSTNVWRYLEAINGRVDLSEGLRKLQCRTLIFIGENSAYHSEAVHMTTKLDRRYGALVEVQGSGSLVTEEQPQAMVIPMEYFLMGYGLYRPTQSSGLKAKGSEHEISSLSQRFMGLKAALVTDSSTLTSFGKLIGLDVLQLSETYQKSDSSPSELLKLLGFEGGKCLDVSLYDSVFVHIDGDNVGMIDSLIGSIMKMAQPGSEIASRLHLSLVLSYGSVTDKDASLFPVKTQQEGLNHAFPGLVPRQSYTMRGEKTRDDVRDYCPMLVAQWQDGVTRRDLVDTLSFEALKKSGLKAKGSEHEISSLSQRFMGLKAALVTDSSTLTSFGKLIGLDVLQLSETYQKSDSSPSDATATELLKLLGFEGGKCLDVSLYDSVFVHIDGDNVGMIDSLIGGIMKMAQPGSEIAPRLHLSVVLSYGSVTDKDASLFPVKTQQEGLNHAFAGLVPRQSCTMRGEKTRDDVRDYCPMLVAQWQDGVTRRDLVDTLSFEALRKLSGNLVIPADRFIHEVAFKLWKAPKYGA
ncbi:hypothetical protein F2Q68_00000389 [Brassica cretica]|uniref:Uncharacterized protein n=1 Tax=Brassica cretica TaxID=69181 RepID=A0A8S9JL53_BRACR|nr:hypothetical protein F2Q68_00000389 [Brassica cretica]